METYDSTAILHQKGIDIALKEFAGAYFAVYLVDFVKETMIPYKTESMVAKDMMYFSNEVRDYGERFRHYLDKYVLPQDCDRVEEAVELEFVRKVLTGKRTHEVVFQRRDESCNIETIRIVYAAVAGETRPHFAMMGIQKA